MHHGSQAKIYGSKALAPLECRDWGLLCSAQCAPGQQLSAVCSVTVPVTAQLALGIDAYICAVVAGQASCSLKAIAGEL